MNHQEIHRLHHSGWLRAAVLGANDGIISTACLLLGVISAGTDLDTVLMTGVAGLVAGALSMATGEYVSVSSQTDTENADLARERQELAQSPELELIELREIYVQRGLDRELASQVAQQLTAHDTLAAHARDELGITVSMQAHPVQAALSSALAFALGALLPLLIVLALKSISSAGQLSLALSIGSILCLAALGAVSAQVSKTTWWIPIRRIVFWGSISMGLSTAIGILFDLAV